MNKLFSKIAAFSVGLAMAIGVGVAVGSKSEAPREARAASPVTLWNTSGGYVASTSFTTSSDGAIKWKNSASNTYSKPTRIYANNTFTIAIADTINVSSIDSVVITANDSSYATATNNATWAVADSGSSISTSVSSKVVTATTTGTVTSITIKPSAQMRWDEVVVYYTASSGASDILDLDGKTVYIRTESGEYYLPNNITTTYAHPGYSTTTGGAQAFDFTLVSDCTYTIQAKGGDYDGYYLSANNSNGSSHKMFYSQSTPHSWKGSKDGTHLLLQDANNRYLTFQGTTDWRGYASRQSGQKDTLLFPAASTSPEVTSVTMTGSPAASEVKAGNANWKMSASATVINDPSSTLTKKINWTVSPSGAVTFSKTQSNSEEEITVYAVNANTSNVKITASSADTGFTSVHADSNTFSITKYYPITSVSLSATTAGGPDYDAGGASSFQVSFTTAITYSDETGSNKVNISVTPDTGVSGQGNNKDAGNFTLTFTKSGTFTVKSTAVEDNTKYATATISVSNIVVPGYELINSTADLIVNKGRYLIYGYNSSKSFGSLAATYSSSTYYTSPSYTASDGFIPTSDKTSVGATEFQLETADGGYYIKDLTTNKYIHHDGATSSANKILQSSAIPESADDRTYFIWTITFDGDVSKIALKNTPTREIMMNAENATGRFATYTGTQQPVYLYKLVDNSPTYVISDTNVYLGVRGTHNLVVTPKNNPNADIAWSVTDDDPDNDVISVSGTGLSIEITALEEGVAVITASFTAHDGNTYDDLVCTFNVIPLDMYVNVGVTKFVKQETMPTGGWDGTYLIVDETTDTMLDGSRTPIARNSMRDVTIDKTGEEYEIAATPAMLSSYFTIKASTHGYQVKSSTNYYIGNIASGKNGIYSSVIDTYEVAISSSGAMTGLTYPDGDSTSTTLRHFISGTEQNYYAFTGSGGNSLTLYKADGDMVAITNTIEGWYDDAKENGYLNCVMSGEGSTYDFESLSDSADEMLSSTDFNTLKKMSSKSAEDGGNFLEDFISDYDYLVSHKGQDDFLDRFKEGGAMYGSPIINGNPLAKIIDNNAATVTAIVVASIVSAAAIGGYFFIRKRKVL